MTPPKPASPCEHYAGVSRYGLNIYKRGDGEIQKTGGCPYCKPAQKPASSCCGAEIIKEHEHQPMHSENMLCNKCRLPCSVASQEKPAESFAGAFGFGVSPNQKAETQEPKIISKTFKQNEDGTFNGVIFAHSEPKETQDAGEIAARIKIGTPYTVTNRERMSIWIAEAIERERAKAEEFWKAEHKKWKDRAKTYTGFEAWACPLCTYKEGKFIESCEMHKRIDSLEQKLAQAREDLLKYGDHSKECRNKLSKCGWRCNCGFTKTWNGIEEAKEKSNG